MCSNYKTFTITVSSTYNWWYVRWGSQGRRKETLELCFNCSGDDVILKGKNRNISSCLPCFTSHLTKDDSVFLGEMVGVPHSRQPREREDSLAVDTVDGGKDWGVARHGGECHGSVWNIFHSLVTPDYWLLEQYKIIIIIIFYYVNIIMKYGKNQRS